MSFVRRGYATPSYTCYWEPGHQTWTVSDRPHLSHKVSQKQSPRNHLVTSSSPTFPVFKLSIAFHDGDSSVKSEDRSRRHHIQRKDSSGDTLLPLLHCYSTPASDSHTAIIIILAPALFCRAIYWGGDVLAINLCLGATRLQYFLRNLSVCKGL